MKKLIPASLLLCLSIISKAQNYQAIHGSPYAGSLGIYNNPATGINSHHNWDITLFSAQLKASTNGFSSSNSIIKLPEANVYLSNGDKPRHLHLSQDFHVLNTRFKLNRRKAVAFGLNTRNYIHVKSNAFKFVDTISSFNSFLQYNRPVPSIAGKAINNAWAELYASYSQIIRKTSADQLSAGLTLKGIRAISGGYLQVDRLRFNEVTQPGLSPTYILNDPSGKYGYSSNYDKLDENSGNSVNDFLVYTQGSLGVDVGVEYLLKHDYAPQYDDDIENLEYNWKIGISILDLGRNFFKHGRFSREFNGAQPNVTEEELENKFSSPDDIEDMYDSLQTVVQQLQSPGANFYISQPTRMVINVDKYITKNFFVNGELSVNFFSTENTNRLRTRELNLLTVTPRWETSLLGVYLPIQFNTQGQLWVGSAFKAGPLLMGIHDWRSLLSKNKIFNGGAYIAIVIKNFMSTSRNRQKESLNCPVIKL